MRLICQHKFGLIVQPAKTKSMTSRTPDVPLLITRDSKPEVTKKLTAGSRIVAVAVSALGIVLKKFSGTVPEGEDKFATRTDVEVFMFNVAEKMPPTGADDLLRVGGFLLWRQDAKSGEFPLIFPGDVVATLLPATLALKDPLEEIVTAACNRFNTLQSDIELSEQNINDIFQRIYDQLA